MKRIQFHEMPAGFQNRQVERQGRLLADDNNSTSRTATYYVEGNERILDEKSIFVAVAGSRSASPQKLYLAHEIGILIAKEGWVLVTGGAKGVDNESFRGTMDGGGKAVIVLPEGINTRHVRKFLSDPDRVCILSEYGPQTRWTVWNAHKRNKTIISLSKAMVAVTFGIHMDNEQSKGGTYNACKEAYGRAKKDMTFSLVLMERHNKFPENGRNVFVVNSASEAIGRIQNVIAQK